MNKRMLTFVLALSLCFSLFSGCDISSKHIEVTYGENDNESISNWDDVDGGNIVSWDDDNITTWSDIDEYSSWVYSTILFEKITEQYPIVECAVLDYRSNGQYFDGEVIYKLVGDDFDVNSFVAKYAVGTGVIVICVILTVATAGGSTPVACFIAGAADGAVSYATKGAAYSAAMEAISVAIKGGDVTDALFGAIEGSADGYMWGAMYGAITGGWNSTFCFEPNTLIHTPAGLIPISEVCIGDFVYSYNESSNTYAYNIVTQIDVNQTDIVVEVNTGEEQIRSTMAHPYYTKCGWKAAADLTVGDSIKTASGDYQTVLELDIICYNEPITVYNLCVDDAHTYAVGNEGLIVHNRCNINSEYAGKTYELSDPELAKKYPNGVPFTKDGFPDFSQYAVTTVTAQPVSQAAMNATDDALKCLTGNNTHDFGLANRLAGYSQKPPGYTWHHHEDMRTLQLIPTDLHMAVKHTGGASLVRNLLKILVP